jgi:hypothetical protein
MTYQLGDRVRLVSMGDDPDPIPAGTAGTVTHTAELMFVKKKQVQVGVRWDNGRSLSCICPPDVLAAEQEAP